MCNYIVNLPAYSYLLGACLTRHIGRRFNTLTQVSSVQHRYFANLEVHEHRWKGMEYMHQSYCRHTIHLLKYRETMSDKLLSYSKYFPVSSSTWYSTKGRLSI